MSHFDSRIHSFIVRVWIEDQSNDAGAGLWRGRIIHVPTGERQYLHDLGEIARFVRDCINHADSDRIDAHSSGSN